MMRSWILKTTLAVAALGWSGVFALSSRASGGTVYVNELPILTLRTNSGGSPAKRAEQASAKLRNLPEGEVQVEGSGRSFRVSIGGRPAITVKVAEAKAAGMSPQGLASVWASKLRAALSLPPLKVSAEQVRLPRDGGIKLSLVGSKAQNAKLYGTDLPVIVNRGVGTLFLKAVKEGRGSLSIVNGDHRLDIGVAVLPKAAQFPQKVTAWVSGSPASAEVVQGAIATALRQDLKTHDSARVTTGSLEASSVSAGSRKVFRSRVTVTAPEAYEATGDVEVEVVNLGIGSLHEAELWYCNDPENVKAPGKLFGGTLRSGKPVRLLFHHINESPIPLVVEVGVGNPSDQPARLLVVPGDSKPDPNPVLAGVQAADEFLRNWLTGSAEVVTIPPQSMTVVALRRLSPKDTASGLQALMLLGGGPQSLRMTATARIPSEFNGLVANWSAAPWRWFRPLPLNDRMVDEAADPNHVYPSPFRKETVVYEVGGKHAFVRIGQKPIARADRQGMLEGNFGVVYSIRAEARNESDTAAQIEVVFEASAGYSGGLFVVDGRRMRSPMLQPKQEFQLARIRLEPGQKRVYNILTLPLSGSSYPATLVMRKVDVLSAQR